MNTSRKLSFKSVVFLVVGSVIGAGIFFKTATVLKQSNQNVLWSLFVWLVAAITVICIGLALIEITEAKSKDNLSMFSWNKRFNSPFVAQCCKYFLLFIYQPLNYFFMPAYIVQSFQDALDGFGVQSHFGANGWVSIMFLSFAIGLWFTFTGVNVKIGNVQNWIVSIINYIPIVATIIMGIVVLSKQGVQSAPLSETTWIPRLNSEGKADFSLFTSTPLIGIFGALGAIFFAFDGFQFAAGVRGDMKNPKQLSKAIIFGLIIITVTYISVALAMTISTKGGRFSDYTDFLRNSGYGWIAGIINLTIAIGVFSIVNSISLWIPRYIENLIEKDELWVPSRFKNKINGDRPWVGVIYELVIWVPIALFCFIFGSLFYRPGVSGYDMPGEDTVSRLYNFADLVSTWTTVFCFGFIALAIYGGLRNRKTQRVEVDKFKYFVPLGLVAVIVLGASMFFSVVEPFINLIIASIGKTSEELWGDDDFISNIFLIINLVLFVILTVIPAYYFLQKKKGAGQNLKTNSN